MRLINNLRELLSQAKLSEREFARRSGVHQPVIHRILNGQTPNPTIETLQKLANYFTMSVSELTGEVPSSENVRINSNHAGWGHVPLFSDQQIIHYQENGQLPEGTKHILTDVAVHAQMFGFTVSENNLSPAISKGDMVIVDGGKLKPQPRTFILVRDKDKISIYEFLIKEGIEYLKSYLPVKHIKKTSQHIIVGSIAQVKKNFQL